MSHVLTCSCGAMEWAVAHRAPGTHIACYCADCQAYAEHLGQTGWLDDQGGTEIFQTVPHVVTLTRGAEHLSVLRLTPKGLLRWYAGCCGTPIANTLSGPALPFVGLVLRAGQHGFGPVRARVNTKAATAPVRSFGTATSGLAVLRRAGMARLRGHASGAPFFDGGRPVVAPVILSETHHAR